MLKVTRKFYYIPLLETIQEFLRNSELRTEILKVKVLYNDDGVYSSFLDGALAETHPIFSQDPNALQIILYYDDISLTASRAKRNKLGMFYFTLGNFNATFRSRVDAISLLAVAQYEDIRSYGVDRVLTLLCEELDQLSQPAGFAFSLDGFYLPLRGAVVAVSADTPASNYLGGYKEGVGGALRKCRHCNTDYETMQSHFEEEDFLPRTLQQHHLQCHVIDQSENLGDHHSTNYGVTRRSSLCDFPFFNVTQQMPQDIMHIIFEGAIPYVIGHLLRYYINNDKAFTLAQFNSRLCGFNYGYSQMADRLQPISKDMIQAEWGDERGLSGFGQQAAKNWLFLRVFPFIVGDWVNMESEQWAVLEKLLAICSILVSPVIHVESVAYLKTLIKDFLSGFKQTFDGVIIPKLHYLVHCPRLILTLGPLVNYWCMRFESKHQYFKKKSRKCSYKNICLSLAKCHQRRFSSFLISTEECSFLFKDSNGKTEHLSGRDFENAKRVISSFLGWEASIITNVYTTSWISVHGTKYIPNKCILLIRSENETPIFWMLRLIWVVNFQILLFRVSMLETVNFNEHLNAYRVQEPVLAAGLDLVVQDQLLSHEVLHIYNFDGDQYISPKTYLSDILK